MSKTVKSKYEDIINMPHHVSKRRPQMSTAERAGQFSPFAALTGHGDAIRETQRITENKIELDENQKELLDIKIRDIAEGKSCENKVYIKYFIADSNKSGGRYVTVSGIVEKIDRMNGYIEISKGIRIPTHDIIDIKC